MARSITVNTSFIVVPGLVSPKYLCSSSHILNKGMINFNGPIMFTSHDHELMQTVANRIIVLNGTKTFDRETTYNDYLGIN